MRAGTRVETQSIQLDLGRQDDLCFHEGAEPAVPVESVPVESEPVPVEPVPVESVPVEPVPVEPVPVYSVMQAADAGVYTDVSTCKESVPFYV